MTSLFTKGKTIENISSALEDYHLFSIVRHPFERLASAYQFLMKTQIKLIKRRGVFRKDDLCVEPVMLRNKTMEGLTRERAHCARQFANFARYVVSDVRTAESAPERMTGRPNRHWQPMFNWCLYCDLPYKQVLDLNDEDVDELLKRVSGGKRVSRLNVRKENRRRPFTTKMLMNTVRKVLSLNCIRNELFLQVDNCTMKQLLDIYKEDFLAFGYEP